NAKPIVNLIIELVRIFERENPKLPMRVDHGKDKYTIYR
ncbi:hypothetical protein EZS27_040855, partial [termite gut metagenome]